MILSGHPPARLATTMQTETVSTLLTPTYYDESSNYHYAFFCCRIYAFSFYCHAGMHMVLGACVSKKTCEHLRGVWCNLVFEMGDSRAPNQDGLAETWLSLFFLSFTCYSWSRGLGLFTRPGRYHGRICSFPLSCMLIYAFQGGL